MNILGIKMHICAPNFIEIGQFMAEIQTYNHHFQNGGYPVS